MSSEVSSNKISKQSRHGPRRGNPYKPIDWDKVDQLIIQGCNGVQVAAQIGVSTDTLYDRCTLEKNTNFSAYFQSKRAVGDSYIHQAQYHKALKEKNTTMLIWLGKQRCGQKERDEETDKAPPLSVINDKDDENMLLKAKLAKIESEYKELKALIANQSETRQELCGSEPPVQHMGGSDSSGQDILEH